MTTLTMKEEKRLATENPLIGLPYERCLSKEKGHFSGEKWPF